MIRVYVAIEHITINVTNLNFEKNDNILLNIL